MTKTIVETLIERVVDFEEEIARAFRILLGSDKATPYVKLACIGARYLQEILQSRGRQSPDITDILKKSPAQMWAEAADVETKVALVKAEQMASLKR